MNKCLNLIINLILLGDILKAEDVLFSYQTTSKEEEKLSSVMKTATSSAQLASAINEANKAGVKTQAAKKMLKVMQGVEVAISQCHKNPSNKKKLELSIESAEQNGLNQHFINHGKKHLEELSLMEIEVFDEILNYKYMLIR